MLKLVHTGFISLLDIVWVLPTIVSFLHSSLSYSMSQEADCDNNTSWLHKQLHSDGLTLWGYWWAEGDKGQGLFPNTLPASAESPAVFVALYTSVSAVRVLFCCYISHWPLFPSIIPSTLQPWRYNGFLLLSLLGNSSPFICSSTDYK